MSRFSRKNQSGFALIFVLVFLTLLMIFLIAAQGSVVTSTHLIQRSSERMQKSEIAAILLTQALAKLHSGAAAQPAFSIEAGEVGITGKASIKPLQAADPTYGKTPGMAHREGDALAEVSFKSKNGEDEKQVYLINGARKRGGAIRIQ